MYKNKNNFIYNRDLIFSRNKTFSRRFCVSQPIVHQFISSGKLIMDPIFLQHHMKATLGLAQTYRPKKKHYFFSIAMILPFVQVLATSFMLLYPFSIINISHYHVPVFIYRLLLGISSFKKSNLKHYEYHLEGVTTWDQFINHIIAVMDDKWTNDTFLEFSKNPEFLYFYKDIKAWKRVIDYEKSTLLSITSIEGLFNYILGHFNHVSLDICNESDNSWVTGKVLCDALFSTNNDSRITGARNYNTVTDKSYVNSNSEFSVINYYIFLLFIESNTFIIPYLSIINTLVIGEFYYVVSILAHNDSSLQFLYTSLMKDSVTIKSLNINSTNITKRKNKKNKNTKVKADKVVTSTSQDSTPAPSSSTEVPSGKRGYSTSSISNNKKENFHDLKDIKITFMYGTGTDSKLHTISFVEVLRYYLDKEVIPKQS